MADLKLIYRTSTEDEAISNLELLKKWNKKYPNAIKSWENNGDIWRFRKVTMTKAVFPTEQRLSKMLYLATEKIQDKWTMRYRGWDMILAQLNIFVEIEL